MILVDANNDVWEKRWFVLKRYVVQTAPWIYSDSTHRPYLHMYAHSNELEEVGIVSLTGVNVESDPHKESLLGKPFSFTLFTASNSHALAAPNLKEQQQWVARLDPTRFMT
jgi:kinesin family member 1